MVKADQVPRAIVRPGRAIAAHHIRKVLCMDARTLLFFCALIAAACGSAATLPAADYSTTNFVIRAPDGRFAQQVGQAAETYRRELAVRWLGEELAPWPEKCPIVVRIEPQAYGQTSFGFAVGLARSQPTGWQMEVCGSPERILDSVLPHEITHTIFATHFGRPLPRWADEGACTTVEHESERSKNHQLLFQFFNERRTIPFNRMYTMKKYPQDIYPIYAQGYSVARYLIMQGGHRRFVDYIDAGLSLEGPGRETRAWDAVTKKYYGFENLSDLQVSWIQWIKQGCPNVSAPGDTPGITPAPEPETVIAKVDPGPTTQNNPPRRTPAQQIVQANSGDSAVNWYRSQAARVAAGEQPNSPTDQSNSPAHELERPYRPGSTAHGRAVDELIAGEMHIRPAGELRPAASAFYGQSEIVHHPSNSPPATVWR